ncbi:MAG: flagellar biosynthesis protein FlhB [Phycisphaeraceae bacterium]|nr:flagellar biosynthesis protein FlhB [Phycisphaeraceae bacterium]
MAENDQERTESPTARRREEARNEGNVARSVDLQAAIALLSAIFLLYMLGLRIMGSMRLSFATLLAGASTDNPTRADDVPSLLFYCVQAVMSAAGPLVLALAAVAVLAGIAQVGFLLTSRPLQLNLAKLSPLRGLRNLFDARSAVRLGMSVAKLFLIASVACWVIYGDLQTIIGLAALPPMAIFGAAAEIVFWLGVKLALLLLLLGLIDYLYQRFQRERDLRMTKQEIREEFKRMEGDPLIKQRRFRVARQLAMQRINQAVPKADVIVTNPTHFAVALQYDSKKMTAPKVVAKGADFLAMRIRQLAVIHGIPIVERQELARALYRSVEVGQEIPASFYATVAEILAYVYRLSGRRSA